MAGPHAPASLYASFNGEADLVTIAKMPARGVAMDR